MMRIGTREKEGKKKEKKERRPVASQFHGLDLGAKLEFCNALVLIIVPDEDLVVGESFVIFASNKGENVASKQHLHDPNPTLKLCKGQSEGNQKGKRVRLWAIFFFFFFFLPRRNLSLRG